MKPIEFCGRSLEVVRQFPATIKRESGYQLDRLQHGFDPQDWKPMTSIGAGVREIRIQDHGQYRIIYVAKFSDSIYVLHALQKKTQKTRKTDIDTARHEYEALKRKLLK
ncbi:MAG: type II toxin-antitoxin system RelE/ParE family toxin [Pseudomonadales bacterium]|nr:type II toxin-antitoxin system RelE/ParE family toxin [Pseudomonadales bacterium]